MPMRAAQTRSWLPLLSPLVVSIGLWGYALPHAVDAVVITAPGHLRGRSFPAMPAEFGYTIDTEAVQGPLRVPADNEARANLHVGGRALHSELTARDLEICARIGPRLREKGVIFAGIDVLGEVLTEINITSPTGLREIEQLSGVALEVDVMDAVEARRRP